MTDLSEELVDAARQILRLVDGQFDGEAEVPQPPNEPDAKKELATIHYQALVNAAAERRKTAVEAKVAAQKLLDDRENTARSNDFEREKAATEAQVDRDAATQAEADKRLDNDIASEAALVKSVHDAYLSLAQGALDRAMKRAEFLTAVVTGLTAIYTGVLGFTFSSAAGNTPLPARGLLPGIFLGLALVLASTYVAFIRAYGKSRQLLPSGLGGQLAQERLVTFFDWTFSGVLRRAWALRLSVVSLAVAVALLPIPFVDLSPRAVTWTVIIAFAFVAAAGVIELVLWRGQTRHDPPGSDVPGPLASR
jgi:hypothetical protein